MRQSGGTWREFRSAIVLAALVAVLLPVGAFAAATVSPGSPVAGGDGRVDAAGFGQETLIDDVPTTIAAVASTTVPAAGVPMSPLPPTTLPRGTATTVRPPAGSVTTTTAVPPPGAVPTTPSTTAAPKSQTSAWSRSQNGSFVRMRMEPAMPVAGQPVTFYVDDVTAPDSCCVVHMLFGDGAEASLLGKAPAGPNLCEGPTNNRTGLSTTHTFAEPGAYEVRLIVITVPCKATVVQGKPVPAITGTDIQACIAVGPGTALPPRCAGS
jgi:hypothetical protein